MAFYPAPIPLKKGRLTTAPNLRVNRKNPKTKGLRVLCFFANGVPYDVVSRRPLVEQDAEYGFDEDFFVKFPSYTGADYLQFEDFDCSDWEGVTCMSEFDFNSNASEFPAIWASVGSGNYFGNFLLNTDGNNNYVQFRAGNSATVVNSQTFSDNERIFAAGIWDKSTMKLQTAGVGEVLSEVSTSHSPSFVGQAAENYIGYYSRTSGRSYVKPIYFVALWDRALSDEEVESIRRDPSQLVEIPLTSGHFSSAAGATYTLTAEQATYTVTGGNAGLTANFKLSSEQATYTLTGGDAGLTAGRQLSAEQATYTLTGGTAGLTANFVLTAEQASYTLTGGDVTFTYNSSSDYTLTAEQASYTLTVGNAGLTANFTLTAETGLFTLTGGDVTFAYSADAADSPTGGWEKKRKTRGNYDFLNPPTRQEVEVAETVRQVAKKQIEREAEESTELEKPKADRKADQLKELQQELERKKIKLEKEHEEALERAREKAIDDAIREQLILHQIITIEEQQRIDQEDEEIQLMLMMLSML